MANLSKLKKLFRGKELVEVDKPTFQISDPEQPKHFRLKSQPKSLEETQESELVESDPMEERKVGEEFLKQIEAQKNNELDEEHQLEQIHQQYMEDSQRVQGNPILEKQLNEHYKKYNFDVNNPEIQKLLMRKQIKEELLKEQSASDLEKQLMIQKLKNIKRIPKQ